MKYNILITIAFVIACTVIACQQKQQDKATFLDSPIATTENITVIGKNKYATEQELMRHLNEVQRRLQKLEHKTGLIFYAEWMYYNESASAWDVHIPDGPGTSLLYVSYHDIDTILKFLESTDFKQFQ